MCSLVMYRLNLYMWIQPIIRPLVSCPAGTTFNTPSAFSVHVKRLITPNKQGDDGWHSVYVDGVLLNAVRQQYYAKMLGQPYKQSTNKTARRSHSSPQGQQQAQQQQVQSQQQQPQQLGLRPPLPMPKLKLGNIKGLPQHAQQQQAQEQQQVRQPAHSQEQTQPKPHKLKFKMKLGGKTDAAAGAQPAANGAVLGLAAGAAAAAGQQQQQQELGSAVLPCPLDPHQPVLQEAPEQQQLHDPAAPRW
jgi:hypothetical protein